MTAPEGWYATRAVWPEYFFFLLFLENDYDPLILVNKIGLCMFSVMKRQSKSLPSGYLLGTYTCNIQLNIFVSRSLRYYYYYYYTSSRKILWWQLTSMKIKTFINAEWALYRSITSCASAWHLFMSNQQTKWLCYLQTHIQHIHLCSHCFTNNKEWEPITYNFSSCSSNPKTCVRWSNHTKKLIKTL